MTKFELKKESYEITDELKIRKILEQQMVYVIPKTNAVVISMKLCYANMIVLDIANRRRK